MILFFEILKNKIGNIYFNKVFFYLSIVLMLYPLLLFSQDEMYLSEKDSKYKNVYDVLTKLNSVDEGKMPNLKILSLISGKFFSAMSDISTHTIYLTEKLLDICYSIDSYNNNSLALILAHELIHIRYHSWSPQFFESLKKVDDTLGFANIIKVFKNNETNFDNQKRMEIETEADNRGAFLAYQAGYDIRISAVNTLKAIYDSFGNVSENDGYPEFDERINIMNLSINELNKWADVFDVGVYCFVIGDYKLAESCFNRTAEVYRGKEIYNNVGVCELLEVLSKINLSDDKSKSNLLYPIEIDPNNRLSSNSSKGVDTVLNKDEILAKAIENFNKALKIDKNYNSAKINLCIANILYDKLGSADDILSELEKIKTDISERQFTNLKILKGNLLYTKYIKDKNSDILEKAKNIYGQILKKEPDNIIAKTNLQIANNEPIIAGSKIIRTGIKQEKTEERLQTFKNTLFPGSFKNDLPIEKIISENVKIYSADSAKINELGIKENLFCISIKNKAKLIFQFPRVNSETQNGIKLYSDISEVILTYNQPTNKINLSNGECWVYEDLQIAFLIKEEKVNNWFVYFRNN